RSAPVDAARELIQKDDQAQAPPRPIGPGGKLPSRRPLEQPAEARANVLIAPPAKCASSVPEPEEEPPIQHVRGQRHRAEPEIADAARLIHVAASLRHSPRRPRTSSRAAARRRAW